MEIRGYTYLSSSLRATVSTGADLLHPLRRRRTISFLPLVPFRHSPARGQAFVSTLLPLFDPLIKSPQAAPFQSDSEWTIFWDSAVHALVRFARTDDISDVFHAEMEFPSRNFCMFFFTRCNKSRYSASKMILFRIEN